MFWIFLSPFIIFLQFIFLIFMKVLSLLNWLKPIAAIISVGLRLKPEFTNINLGSNPGLSFSIFFDLLDL